MRESFLSTTFAVLSVLGSLSCQLAPGFSAAAAQANPPAASSTTAVGKYHDESIVILRSDALYSMNREGTGFRELTLQAIVQSEAAVREIGILNVGFASASEHVEILYARVRRPDGTVIETPVADALEQPQPVTREAPFYSDLKQKQLPIKNLRVGDTLEWKIRVVRTRPEAPGQFWGQSTFVEDGIALSETLELRVPSDMTVKVWTNPKLKVTPTQGVSGDQTTYRWQSSTLKPTAGPEAEAEKKRKEKQRWTLDQETDAKEGTLPSVAWTTFKSWEEVGEWYRTLEADRTLPDAALKAKVTELTANKSTLEQKARAVYGFVGPQVRYIGVAFGVGRYQPHHAEEVLENQYGDCKDKHTLLAAMLTALGLHPDAVLVGSGIRLNDAVPSPGAFNHLITRVDVEGKETWLDSTAEVAPYGMLSAAIRDKQVLVVADKGPAHLEKTPATPPFASFQTMKVEGTLTKDGVEDSRVTLKLRGDAELFLREILHQVPPAQYEALSQKLWGSMGFDGTASHPDLGRAEDTADPLSVAFDDKREKAGGDWEHFRIVAQLLPASMPEFTDKDPPVRTIELGAPQTVTSSYIMKLPEGWGAELPEAVHEKAPFATYDQTFRVEKGSVYADRKLVTLQEHVPAPEWDQYRKWMEKTSPNSSPYIQLTRSSRKPDPSSTGEKSFSSGPPLPSVTNPAAAKLIGQAFDLMRDMNVTEAEPLLDQARALNQQEKSLWAGYGYLNVLRGAPTEATRDYRKELHAHPDGYYVYPMLVYCQLQMHKRKEGMEVLREWASADPSDPTPAMQLSGLQLEDGNGAAAYATMNDALSKLPEDRRKQDDVVLAMARAEMKDGMKAKAAGRLVDLLKSTENPGTLNDGAYYLSEANVELPVAEAAERRALARMEAETSAWTLDEAPAVLKQKSALLAASWDTMGWILFREGKLKESRTFVDPAWHNRTDALVGEHMGDIEMALQNPPAALRDYQLARAAGATEAMLAEKESKARAAGGEVTLWDAQKALRLLRTVDLGASSPLTGEARYKLLLSKSRVERVEPAEDKQIPGGAEIIAKMPVAQLFPATSNARLAKWGTLTCAAGQCQFVFEP